jgi:cell division protease FtsH
MQTRPPTPPESLHRQKQVSWILLSLFFWIAIAYLFNFFAPRPIQEQLSYTAFKEKVRSGEIDSVTIKGDKITGTYTVKDSKEDKDSKNDDGSERIKPASLVTIIPPVEDDSLLSFLEEHDVSITAEEDERSVFWSIVIGLLPWLLIIGFFVYTTRQMKGRLGGSPGPFGFGKSKAKLFRKSDVQVTFKDVAGLDNAKQELMEVVDFLRSPGKYHDLGAELPKGLLLVGPPGVGKTLLARAAAGEAEVTFYSISGSEFIEMFVGVGASRVRDMFEKAKKEAPSIIFIDELDSIGRVRGTGVGGGHDEREQTLNQILSEMDGFSPQESMVVIAATNRPDVLDPALVRPGRFDRQITLDLPHKEARRKILELHCADKPLQDGIDFDSLAVRTVGFSGADLKNLVNEAVLMAARKNKKNVSQDDFEDGRDKIILGLAREDLINEKEKEVIACHEAGHTLVALLTSGADPIKKVTIIPHGRSLGATEQVPQGDQYNLGKKSLITRIKVLLAGQAAEIVVYDDITTGAGDDLKKATELTRRMITEWGMSENLGPVAFKHGTPHPFLGQQLTEPKDYSEKMAWLIDKEIQDQLEKIKKETVDTLSEHRGKLDRLRKELLEQETLSIKEIRSLLDLKDRESS